MSNYGYGSQPNQYGQSADGQSPVYGYPGGQEAVDAYGSPAGQYGAAATPDYGSAPAYSQGAPGYTDAQPYGSVPAGYTAPGGYPVAAGYPVTQGGYVQAPPTNNLALISLIMSLVGIVTSGMTSIVGIIMGHMAKSQIKRTGEGGDSMATWGLIVGYVVLGGWVLFWIIYIIFVIGMVVLGVGMSTY